MIRIGLLGASRIAVPAIIEPAAEIDGVEVSAVAARSPERAAAYAARHGIREVEPDYRALVASDEVDLVYNALPPNGHMEWSLAAMISGKDVLCEKPFAMNAGEAQRMVDTADRTGRVLIEAFHYRFHPLFDRVLQILAAGEIGVVQSLKAHFNIPIPYQPGELRHEPALGGGALMDLGCYPLHWVRSVMRAEPAVVSAKAIQQRAEIDEVMQAVLEFPGGQRAKIACSMAADLPPGLDAELVVAGDKGSLTVSNPLAPHSGHELIVATDGGSREETVVGRPTYYHQLQHVLAALAGKTALITGGRDAINNMAAIDAIYRAAGMQPRGQIP